MGMAFRGSHTLYVAGWDRTVQVWKWDKDTGKFVRHREEAFRMPIGPGLDGVINALTLSSDGQWLAVGGQGLVKNRMKYAQEGWAMPLDLLTDEDKEDRGQINVYRTDKTDQAGERHQMIPLRGHRGSVMALAFAPVEKDCPLLLASFADEEGDGKQGRKCSVKVWDVTDKKPLKTVELRSVKIDFRPSLVVHRLGKGQIDDLEVAIAAGDGTLRVWRVAESGAQPKVYPEERARISSLHLYGERGLAAAYARREGTAGLRFWDGPDWGQSLEKSTVSEIPGAGVEGAMPVALALFDSPAEPRKVGTLVSRRGKRDASSPNIYSSIHLGILDKDKKYVQTESIDLADLPIENYKPTSPTLAVSPEGKWLAVACGHEHAIHIYDIAKQVTCERRPTQTLKSKGKTFHEAFFVSGKAGKSLFMGEGKGDSLGLRQGGAKGWIFDLEGRAIRPDSETKPIDFGDGWILTPDPKEIQVSHPRSNRHGTIRIDEGYSVTGLQWLPPKGDDQTGVPIVAVALLDESRSPVLRLYDGSTGKMVCWLNGHIDTIRSLAFFRDRDRRWLVSACDDQTVCIWNLSAFEKARQARVLEGVYADWKDPEYKVEQVDPASFNVRFGILAKDDIIEEIERDGAVHSFQGPDDLWEAIRGAPLGIPVKLIRRREGKSEAVNVTLVQAMKEIKPELTLFLMPKDEQTEEFSWVAWKPSGQYDFSLDQEDPKGEGLLGWHRNPQAPDGPVEFDPLELKSNERADSPWRLLK